LLFIQSHAILACGRDCIYASMNVCESALASAGHCEWARADRRRSVTRLNVPARRASSSAPDDSAVTAAGLKPAGGIDRQAPTSLRVHRRRSVTRLNVPARRASSSAPDDSALTAAGLKRRRDRIGKHRRASVCTAAAVDFPIRSAPSLTEAEPSSPPAIGIECAMTSRAERRLDRSPVRRARTTKPSGYSTPTR
jgi:hypothetical protein